jgi:hypothetical protein
MIPLTPLIAVWAVLVPLVDEVPDPEDVKPGWLGFGVFLLLAAAVVLLVLSLRKQLRKVNFDERGDAAPAPEGSGRETAAGESAPGEPSGAAEGAEAHDQGDGEDGSRSS